MPNDTVQARFISLTVLLLFCTAAHATSLVKGSVTREQNNGCFDDYSNHSFTATTPSVVVVVLADPLVAGSSVYGASLSGGPALALPAVRAQNNKSAYQVFTDLTPGLVYTVYAGGSCVFPQGSTLTDTFEVYEFLCPGGPSQPVPDPEVPYFSWTLSPSSTDPFVSYSASSQSTLYLWLVCSPPEGIGVAKFRLYGGTIASKVFAPGVLNAGSGNDFVLAFSGCFTPPARVATISLTSPSSAAWLGPTLGISAQMVSGACGSSELLAMQIRGFSTSTPRTSPNFCGYQPVTQQLFWTDRTSFAIEASDVTGGNRRLVLSTSPAIPRAITARTGQGGGDLAGTLYWTEEQDAGIETVHRVDFDGTDALDFVPTGVATAEDVEFNELNSYVYWIDSAAPYDGIYRAPLFSGVAELVVPSIVDGTGLALDLQGGRIYWTDRSTHRIYSAAMAGSDRVTFLLLSSSTGLGDIDFDPVERKLYWMDEVSKTISYAAVQPSPTATILLDSTDGLSLPNQLAVDCYARKILWGDSITSSVRRATLEGTDIVTIASTVNGKPHGIALAQRPVESVLASQMIYGPFGPPAVIRTMTAEQGNFAESSLTLTNVGNLYSSGTLIADCPQFTVLGDPSFGLSENESATFTVRFTPTSSEWAVGELRFAEGSGLSSRLLLIGETLAPVSAPGTVGPRFALHGGQPNPFNAGTSIHFDLPRAGAVEMELFDVAGRLVRKLLDKEPFAAGPQAVLWDGRDDHDQRVASGVYVCRIQAGSFAATQRLALVK